MDTRPSRIEYREDSIGDLKIILPAPRQGKFTIVILAIWLVGWAISEMMVISSYFAHPLSPHPPVFFILLWTLGGLNILWSLLWTAFGKEIISLSNYRMKLRREVFGIGFDRNFEQRYIPRLWPSPKGESVWWELQTNANRQRIITPFDNKGTIAFDYRSKTYRFGEGIEEDEAKEVVARLNAALEQ